MMMGLPIVSRLKCWRSAEICHGNLPSTPMTPFSARAMTNVIFGAVTPTYSHGNLGGDVGHGVIALDGDVFEFEAEDVFHIGIEFQLWQRARRAHELFAR